MLTSFSFLKNEKRKRNLEVIGEEGNKMTI